MRKEVPDVTTKKGRDAIGSLAMKVGASLKIIEDAGKVTSCRTESTNQIN